MEKKCRKGYAYVKAGRKIRKGHEVFSFYRGKWEPAVAAIGLTVGAYSNIWQYGSVRKKLKETPKMTGNKTINQRSGHMAAKKKGAVPPQFAKAKGKGKSSDMPMKGKKGCK